ncbi:MAG: GNAT family protein, partial [Spirochaeta sp.]|nr:GNAT family protein [Spirochaeta sp.]
FDGFTLQLVAIRSFLLLHWFLVPHPDSSSIRVYGNQCRPERAIASYRKIGFQEVGRRRKAIPREGAEHDLVFMDILDGEFFALHSR